MKLREYLATLGWQIDEASYARFRLAVSNTASGMATLGTEVTAAALSIAAATAKVAERYSDLYYSSQRTGASVANLRAIEAAAGRAGISVGELSGSVESFAQKMRSGPQFEELLRSFGVDLKLDPVERMLSLVEKLFAKFPGTEGAPSRNKWLDTFGLDERTALNLHNNMAKVLQALEESKKKLKDAGKPADDMAGDFVKLNDAMAKFQDNMVILKDAIAHYFTGPLTTAIEKMDEWLTKFNEVNKTSGGVLGATGAGVVAFGIGAALKKAWDGITGLLRRGAGGGATPPVAAPGAGAPAAALPATTESMLAGMASFLAKRLLLAVGILIDSTEPAEGGPALMKRNPKTGEMEYTPEGRRFAPEVAPGAPGRAPLGGPRPLPVPAPPATAPRAGGRVLPSPKWWGDDEAEKAGLYDKSSFLPAGALRPAAASMMAAATLNNKTEVTIAPGATALETAGRVAALQDDVNARAIRDLAGVLT